jgi:DNA-binding NarL/FixJ family response regulator
VQLALHDRTPSGFERARTELCYGEQLRRARAELRATGETARRRDPTAAERLTPQELQVALAVGVGRTNRDVAAALFLSPKTIEYHLGNIYRKLDVRSRAQLAHLLAREGSLGVSG